MSNLMQDGGCACCSSAEPLSINDRFANAARRLGLGAELVGGGDPAASVLEGGSRGEPAIVCTLEGAEAMRERLSEWEQVIGAATGRESADGGITLTFAQDGRTAVELARLAVAEFECCSFFTFALSVGPAGMRFTVTAPDEAHDVVTALFGTATS
ncbi:hypothetical protein [Acrocarpospora sp. B8E8]|uniref:hypothetical protein n=1 Tax=Acrocarpospora sp. B8E8 TaxID=3153572 RepID=UPI00325C4358